MAYEVVERKIKALGFCCAYSYFYAVRAKSTSEINNELRVTERTINRWRRAFRDERINCSGARNCFLVAPTSPDPHPDSAPALASDIDLVLDDECVSHHSGGTR